MEHEPIVIEKTLNASPEKIWQAMTETEQMKMWSFDIADFKPEVGYQFTFVGGPPHKVYHHVCVITDAVPMKKLAYTWRYEGYAGISHVTFELVPEGNLTTVRITHKDVDTFPQNEPDLARNNFVDGWTYILGTSLRQFVEM